MLGVALPQLYFPGVSAFKTTLVLLILISTITIFYTVYTIDQYLQYKIITRQTINNYIHEAIIPYESRVALLEDKVGDLEAHAFHVLYFERIKTSRKYKIMNRRGRKK